MKKLLLLGLLLASPLAAQEQTVHSTTGFSIGAALNGISVSNSENDGTESGGGLSLRIGYGFSGHAALFLRGSGAQIRSAGPEDETYIMTHADLGLRYGARPGQRVNPFAEVGLSSRLISVESPGSSDIEARGYGAYLGVGTEVFLMRRAALDIGLTYTGGKIDRMLNPIDGGWDDLGGSAFSVDTVRLDIGMNLHP